MILIRLAPYPFNVMNALLSATHIPLSTFSLATALSLTKLALHVYIGSTLSSLAPVATTPEGETTNPDGSLPSPTDPTGTPTPTNNVHSRNLKIVFMVISIIIGFVVGAYVWTVAKREIAASEGIRIERRRKKRASLRQNRASMRSIEGLGSGRDSHPQQHQLLARSGSSGGIVELGQDNVPAIDLTSSTVYSGSDFVGGAPGFSINGYQDDEDDDLEDQALVGSGERLSHHPHSLSRSGINLTVGGGAGHADYGSDSEESDFLDDDDEDDYDDDDMSDMERGIDSDDEFKYGRNSRRLSLTGHNSTEMDVRDQPPRHSQGSSLGASQNTRGWFTDNGVDISDNDRGW